MSAPELLVLETGTARCQLCPELGGSIMSWSVAGQPMLLATAREDIEWGKPRTFASFPLSPIPPWRWMEARMARGYDETLFDGFA